VGVDDDEVFEEPLVAILGYERRAERAEEFPASCHSGILAVDCYTRASTRADEADHSELQAIWRG